MCRYCNFDIYTHYVINGELSLESSINLGSDTDELIEDLSIATLTATNNQTSIYELKDLFNYESENKIEYSAIAVDGKELPDWIALDPHTGKFTIAPEQEVIGNYEIAIQTIDKFGKLTNSLLALEVVSQNDKQSSESINSIFVAIQTTQPQISIDDVRVTDSSAGRELVFTVSLNAASSETVTVDYSTSDRTAVAGEDYIAVGDTLTFAPGETSKTIVVNTTGTSYLDDDESFAIDLSNATNADIDDGEGEGTILPAHAGIRGWSRSQETVTFSFFDEDVFGQGGYDGSNRESNAREASEVVKASYREIFDHLNTFVDREFVEVAESESEVGNIRIVVSDAPDYAYAGGHIHLAGWAAASDAGINGWESVPGVYAYSALLHELGHALGMPHSFGKESSVFDPEENSSNTVMSYTFPGNHPGTFMAYDIKSLQERYGANEYRHEDTVYEFVTVDNYTVDGELAIDTSSRLKQTIWDSGGTDTFDFSNLAIDDSGYRFDLNQSKYQTTQNAYESSSYTRNGTKYYVPTYGTSIAIDVEIENVVNSSSDDLIIANPAANIFSGYEIELNTGDDLLIATDNLDTLDLSAYSFFDIRQTKSDRDLKIELGLNNSISIEDYFSTAEENRINILLNGVEAFISDVSIAEGNSGTKTANFIVNLDAASDEVIEIDYTTLDGNAKAGSDYIPQTGTLTFNAGETNKAIAVEVVGDTIGEADETFGLNLLGSYGQVINTTTATITNDDGAVPLPTLNITDATATDGNSATKAVFTVSLDRSHDTEITVDYSTVDGMAIAGEDYLATSGRLAFAPGETAKTIEIEIIGDSISDRNEDFAIELSNVSSNATIFDAEGTGNIIDPTLQIELADGTNTKLQLASYPPDGNKDPNNLAFEVTPEHNSLSITGNGNGWKEIPLGEAISDGVKPLNSYSVIEFDFKSDREGKLHGIHFEGKDHHAFYSPWEKDRFFQLYGSSEFGIQDFNNYDSIAEWKTYQIPVHQYFDTNNWRNYGKWVVFAHEGDDENSNTQFRNLKIRELLPISVSGVTLSEEDGVANFILTLPEASDEVITLNYATVDDTAIAGEDYTATSGTVTFNPGETTQTITIAVEDDSLSEGNESFGLNLNNVNNAIALNSNLTATITDDDTPLPVISVGDININEGNTDTSATVTISLDKSWTEAITLDYSTLDNTAVVGDDYQAVNGSITFNPGETSKNIEIAVIGDVLNETDESFYFQISNAANGVINDTQATVTIDNDDALPSINIEDAGVLSSIPVRDSNGNIKNTTGLLFKITLDAPSNQTIKVDYATADGTAIAGEDYTQKNKTLTFKPGETEKQVFVGVTLDDTEEVDENLYLNLSNPVNAVIIDNKAIGTIEETRSLSVSDLSISEAGNEALFVVSLNKPSVQGVFVDYATEDGTAIAGADYTQTKGRLFIKAGEASATIAVPIIDNNLTELDENFFLNLSNPKYVLIDDFQGQATIINDDAIPTVNPGGIHQNLQLWLKADDNVVTDNGVVTWGDNSQAKIDLGQDNADSRPTLEANGLNHNPVISFDGSNDTLTSLKTLPAGFASEDVSIYIVSQSDRTNQRSTILAATPDDTYKRFLVHLPYSGKTYFDRGSIYNGGRLSTSFDTPNTFQMWNFQAETEVGQSILLNGLEIASDSDVSSRFNSLDKTLELSSLISSDAFEGDIAEVIVFNQALDRSDRNAVDSYLGIKYGFTLDQTTPNNYVTSDSSIIWNATTAGNYNQDIAGIAIDDASDLNQTKSRSSNDDGIVTIGNASDLDNGEALIWSNDGGAIDAESVSLTNGNYYISRQWQVQQTGDVGTVDLSFDLEGLGYTSENVDEFALLIDDDGDFSNAALINTGLEVNGNEVSFNNIDLQNGQYFSLAVPEKQAPGGIKSNLQLWLRGDAIVTDNNNIIEWRDRSGKNRNYTPEDTEHQPVLATEEFNFNPAVSFDGNDLLTTTRTNFTQGEVFFVLKGQDNGGNSALLGDRNYYDKSNFKYEQWWNKGKLGFTRRGVGDYTSNLDSPNNLLSLLSFSSDADSNIIDLAIENNGILSQDSLDIGASNPISIEYLAQSFKGEIAEVVVFDNVLSDTEKLQLRSNLAIKYGLSLDLNSNYVNSDDRIWWDANLAGEYHNDVAGIAKDYSADLAQIKSRSSNADSIVTIEAEDTVNGLEDGEALIWGNNREAINNSDAIDLSQRIWQVQENQGDVGKVSVSFDLSNLREELPLKDYALQISNDENFNDSQFHTFGSSIDNGTLTFTGVDFNHGDYFSLNTEYSSYVTAIEGTNNNDRLTGTNEDEVIYGYGGNDRLRGGNGNDTIDGGEGRDILLEAGGGDFLLTDDTLTSDRRGTDSFSNIEAVILHGHHDDNEIDGSATSTLKGMFYGKAGNDTLIGGNGNNVLKGGDGNDILYGKGGINIVFGNNGADIFALEANSGKIVIKDFENNIDSLGLTNLEFGDLRIVENRAGTTTFIKDSSNNAVLAVLHNIDAADFTADDFINI